MLRWIRELNLNRRAPGHEKILSNQAVKKFMHNRKAVLGLIIVCFLVLAVILIPIFMKLDPYTTDRAVGFNSPPMSQGPSSGHG
ncbi:MAG: hypothetical protein ACLR78_03285 [Roseburia sp.]